MTSASTLARFPAAYYRRLAGPSVKHLKLVLNSSDTSHMVATTTYGTQLFRYTYGSDHRSLEAAAVGIRAELAEEIEWLNPS